MLLGLSISFCHTWRYSHTAIWLKLLLDVALHDETDALAAILKILTKIVNYMFLKIIYIGSHLENVDQNIEVYVIKDYVSQTNNKRKWAGMIHHQGEQTFFLSYLHPVTRQPKEKT